MSHETNASFNLQCKFRLMHKDGFASLNRKNAKVQCMAKFNNQFTL